MKMNSLMRPRPLSREGVDIGSSSGQRTVIKMIKRTKSRAERTSQRSDVKERSANGLVPARLPVRRRVKLKMEEAPAKAPK